AEVDLQQLHPGMTVDIASGVNGKPIKATIREISPIIDQDTRLGTVRIDVPSSAGFKPGNFVRGEIELGDSQVLTVPAEAVLSKNDESFALVIS
ncbi:HlyD family efflux transporter periplasmic adaptor subunit, partial [Streptomyces niveiscabiei]|uniref:HlyD family efflux transporter periplasmic adaptor subunit n=1 Tax=Streptomyces niveiscabiei TaxID=164115 RepID=UPI0038F81229